MISVNSFAPFLTSTPLSASAQSVSGNRPPGSWSSGVSTPEQFCKLKRERRRAERRWVKSKLTVHKQIDESIKREVTYLVDNAKTALFSSIIQAMGVGHPLSWDSSVLTDLHWSCSCTAQSSILSIGSVSLVLLWGIFLTDLGQ